VSFSTVSVLFLPSAPATVLFTAPLLRNAIAFISSIACHLSSTEPNSIMSRRADKLDSWLPMLSMACANCWRSWGFLLDLLLLFLLLLFFHFFLPFVPLSIDASMPVPSGICLPMPSTSVRSRTAMSYVRRPLTTFLFWIAARKKKSVPVQNIFQPDHQIFRYTT